MSIVKFVRVDCPSGPLLAMAANHAPDTVEALALRFEAMRDLRTGNGCEAILFLGRDSAGELSGVCIDSSGRPTQAGLPEALQGLVKISAIEKGSLATVNGQSVCAGPAPVWALACQGLCVDAA